MEDCSVKIRDAKPEELVRPAQAKELSPRQKVAQEREAKFRKLLESLSDPAQIKVIEPEKGEKLGTLQAPRGAATAPDDEQIVSVAWSTSCADAVGRGSKFESSHREGSGCRTRLEDRPRRRRGTPCRGGTVRSAPRPVDAGRRCPLEEGIVDIRRVLHVAHVVAGVEPDTDEGVVGEIGSGVADVGRVVRRDAAHVQAGDRDRMRLKELSRCRVVDARNGAMAR